MVQYIKMTTAEKEGQFHPVFWVTSYSLIKVIFVVESVENGRLVS
jgi:hypothetical protein